MSLFCCTVLPTKWIFLSHFEFALPKTFFKTFFAQFLKHRQNSATEFKMMKKAVPQISIKKSFQRDNEIKASYFYQ